NDIAAAEEAMNLHEAKAPIFDEEFWAGVRSGAARVRQLALNDIAAAEEEGLGVSKKAAAPWRGVLHWKGWIGLAAPVMALLLILPWSATRDASPAMEQWSALHTAQPAPLATPGVS